MLTLICSGIIIILVGLFLLTWKYLFEIVYISGDSMYPTMKDKQLALVKKFGIQYEEGNIYIYRCPDGYDVVKRLTGIEFYIFNGVFLYFEGDNKNFSKDSRHYGFIREKDVIGKVIYWRK